MNQLCGLFGGNEGPWQLRDLGRDERAGDGIPGISEEQGADPHGEDGRIIEVRYRFRGV